MTKPRETRQELMDAIIDAARHDRALRQGLLRDPKAAIFAHFGVQIPEEFSVRFIERDPSVDALIVLPDFQGERPEQQELSDEELEIVVGGAGRFHGMKHEFEWSSL